MAAGAGAASSAAAGFASDTLVSGRSPPRDILPAAAGRPPKLAHASPSASDLCSPVEVGALRLCTSASFPSTQPSTPGLAASAEGDPRAAATPRRGRGVGLSRSSLERSRSSSSADLQALLPPPTTDAAFLVQRLKQPPLTGQVVAWAWGEAAALSQARRAPPVALLAALWSAAAAAAARFTPEDVLDMLEAWMALLQHWPRHFQLPAASLDALTAATFPAAIKRMREPRLAALAALCRDISLHRPPELSLRGPGEAGRSARDLMQPVFALAAAEAAWRAADPSKFLSPEAASIILHSSAAWRWSPVPRHDPPALAALKEATRAALAVLERAAEAPSSGGRD